MTVTPRVGAPWRACLLSAVAAALVTAACGKKGPPLPPLATLPAAPTEVSARRTGDQVIIRFTVPRANITGVSPANLERVDVYGWTGTLATPKDVYKEATVVGSVPVRRPPPPPPEQKPGEPPPPPPPPPTGPGVDQGTAAEVTEALTDAALTPVDADSAKKKDKDKDKDDKTALKVAPPLIQLPAPDTLTRSYLVVGVNHGDDRGPAAQRLLVPLWAPPPPPTEVSATVAEKAITLTWTPPPSARRPIVRIVLPPAARPAPGAARPATPAATPPPQGGVSGHPDEDDEPSVPGPTTGSQAPGATSGTAQSAAPGVAMPQTGSTPAATPAPAPGQTGAEAGPSGAPAPAPPTSASGTGAAQPAPGGATSGSATQTATTPGAPTATEGPASLVSPTNPDGLIPVRLLTPWPVMGDGFVVYEVAPPDAQASAAPPPPAVQPYPQLLTTQTLLAPTFTDTRVVFGQTRCYVVRTREVVGTLSLESASSDRVCVKPVDTFAPAAPKSLGAVASEGAISLIWEANTEPDLAGYLVLRGLAPDGKLAPLTPQPIKETTYRDTAARRGVRYVYVVIAVDTATPPNRSEPSNRVEETAR